MRHAAPRGAAAAAGPVPFVATRTNEGEPVTLHDLAYSSSPRSADPPVSVNPSVHVSTLHELPQDAVETTLRPAEVVLKNSSGDTMSPRPATIGVDVKEFCQFGISTRVHNSPFVTVRLQGRGA